MPDAGTKITYIFLSFFLFFFLAFLGTHLLHMDVPSLGVKSELWLQGYTTATATPDLSCDYEVHPSLQQLGIHNPLIRARG